MRKPLTMQSTRAERETAMAESNEQARQMLAKLPRNFAFGMRVAFSRQFLRSTGQFTGHDAPASSGPFARGTVKAVERLSSCTLVFIHWDDGRAGKVLDVNLVPVDRLHLEPV